MKKLYVEVPVELRFAVRVSVPVDPHDELSAELVRYIRDAAEGAAWNWLEGKVDVGSGEASAASEREFHYNHRMTGISAERYGGMRDADRIERMRKRRRA